MNAVTGQVGHIIRSSSYPTTLKLARFRHTARSANAHSDWTSAGTHPTLDLICASNYLASVPCHLECSAEDRAEQL
jgi:hypothetical protein